MEKHSAAISMLREVIAGRSYDAVAMQHGVTRTVVERQIKVLARKVFRQVGIAGLNEEGIAFAQRLRACRSAINAALARYEPEQPDKKRIGRVLTDDDIRVAIDRTKARSPCPNRDVALLCVLLTTGARPLEIARLEVRDYLNSDGSVRESSQLRAAVTVNRRTRPLFFVSDKVKKSLDAYLAERGRHHVFSGHAKDFRGLDPYSRLFLTDTGTPFEIIRYGELGQTRFLCRGILNTYRKIFRRIGFSGVSALTVRRSVANRLFERGASWNQIGEFLGIHERKSVRQLLPKRQPPLQSVVSQLV